MKSLRLGAVCASALLFAVTTEINAATIVQWKVGDGGNGNWYTAVTLPQQIPWDVAKTDAEAMTHFGESGYLATLTSQAENDFIWQNLGGILLRNYWLGGFQADGSPEPDGGWQWITAEAWDYTNWLPTEPNNLAGGTENRLEFFGNSDGGADNGEWNDAPNDGAPRDNIFGGYIVEFNAVPVPPALYLFGSGLIGLAGMTKRRNNS